MNPTKEFIAANNAAIAQQIILTLTLLLQAVLKTITRFEDSQLERVVDHTGQSSAEELGAVRRGQLTDVEPKALEPGRVNRVIGRVKANAGTVMERPSLHGQNRSRVGAYLQANEPDCTLLGLKCRDKYSSDA